MRQKIIYLGMVGMIILGGISERVDVWAESEESIQSEKVVNDENEDEDEAEEVAIQTELYIKAVNPGYTMDEMNNVGEMIEIGRIAKSDEMVSLAGLTVGYTNSSGNYSVLFEFPEGSYLAGENLLLRLASSPDSELAAAKYTKTLAMEGGIDLKDGERMIDSVCWTGKEECYAKFKSKSNVSLVRNVKTGEFEQVVGYEPEYKAENYVIKTEEEGYGGTESLTPVASQCKGVVFSEILTYYETTKAEQFIEFYNTTERKITLDGCFVKYKNKTYALTGVVEAEGYLAYYPTAFSLTKNPTNSNTLELVDTDEKIVASLTYPNGQKKGTAYAWIGYDEKGEEMWKTTYAPTPGAANNYQQFKNCEEGKVINEATGNCVKATVVTETICKEGQYLNPLTGRCKKYETVATKVCKEGYYYYEPTGRCRKIVENTGTDYSLTPEEYEEESMFIGLWATLGVAGVGGAYLIYEFRHEIGGVMGKILRRK